MYFASICVLIDYKPSRAEPLVFERGLAQRRAEPSDFEGGSAHTLTQLIDLEKDIKGCVLPPWIEFLAFTQEAYYPGSLELWRKVAILQTSK